MYKIVDNILKFLNDNFGLVSLIVGCFAIYLYLKQKKDYKRDAAKLILQEIRYAEQQIRNFRALGSYPLSGKLLPTNSWHSNIHLFVKDFKETDLDLISDFYAKAAYLDIVIANISDAKNKMFIPKALSELGQTKEEDINDKGENINAKLMQFELGAQHILKDVSQKIEFIYNTPAVDRLRIISIKKWYYLY